MAISFDDGLNGDKDIGYEGSESTSRVRFGPLTSYGKEQKPAWLGESVVSI